MEPGFEDRISELPECVISHILSFLPTKSAFATSFLAKNWKLRWTKVSTLHFDDQSWPNHEVSPGYLSFAEFVNKVFITHTGFIEKLLLNWQSKNVQPNYLHMWVEAALARNLSVFDLSAWDGEEFDDEDRGEDVYILLPDALYTCRTLEVLKLQGFFWVVLPHVVCLPKLQEVELPHVKIECEFVEKLISACPVLHSFVLDTIPCNEDVINLKVSSPSLKRLEVFFHWMCQITLEPSWVKLVIDTPAVEFLVFRGTIDEVSCIQERLPVNELDIDFDNGDMSPLKSYSVVRLLQACDDVKTMKLVRSCMPALKPEKPNIGLFPTFQKLTRLTAIGFRLCWLLDLMDRSVNLEVLDVRSSEGSPLGLECNRIPACLSSSLKHLYLWPFGRCVRQMALLEFILKHGLLMETVTLSSYLDDEEKLNMLNKVSMLPRASATCKVMCS